MKINHLIIGTNSERNQFDCSIAFYSQVLGFREVDSFIDTATGAKGRVLAHSSTEKESLEILLVPFLTVRLPNPQHVAFEVSAEEFETVFTRANEEGLMIRSEAHLNCSRRGVGEFFSRGVRYKRFYLQDPAQVNIEMMCRVS